MGEKYKTIVGQLMMLAYPLGQVIIGVVAIFVRDYKTFQVVLSCPCFVLLAVYFLIPESPRWLIAKKKYLQAERVIENAARFNKVNTQMMTT